MALSEDMAESIAVEAVEGAAEDPEVEVEQAEIAALEEESAGEVLPSLPVFDLESLCAKYGGFEQVYEDHRVAQELGYFGQLEELRGWLDYVAKHNGTARQAFVEFEHDRGSRLLLIGTNHISQASRDFAREAVAEEKPDCLVLERRLGDDSLQRLTVPEEMYQELAMSSPPSLLLSSDDAVSRARKFQADKVWLEGTPGWRDIGGEAAICQEFGTAFVEFAQQRASSGSGSGSLCLADCDLRGVQGQSPTEKVLPPSLLELGKGANMPLRDLQLAQAMRAALRTHTRVVGVVGRDHLSGISKLLGQDPRVRRLGGLEPELPAWQEELENGGRRWEREALSGAPLFERLSENAELAPLGTFFSDDAVLELQRMREETAERLRRDGPGEALPVAPASSELGATFFAKGLALTPPDEKALQRWLAGEKLPRQEAGDFPFENRRFRRAAPAVPSSGFGEVRA